VGELSAEPAGVVAGAAGVFAGAAGVVAGAAGVVTPVTGAFCVSAGCELSPLAGVIA